MEVVRHRHEDSGVSLCEGTAILKREQIPHEIDSVRGFRRGLRPRNQIPEFRQLPCEGQSSETSSYVHFAIVQDTHRRKRHRCCKKASTCPNHNAVDEACRTHFGEQAHCKVMKLN